MAPVIVLVVVTLIARATGQLGVASLKSWPAATRVGLAVMFLFTAVAHFNSMRADLIAMVPPFMPNAELMVTLTGIAEILGAVGLLIPRTRRLAAVALIVFLVAVFPRTSTPRRRVSRFGGRRSPLSCRASRFRSSSSRCCGGRAFVPISRGRLLNPQGVFENQGPGARGQGRGARGERGLKPRARNNDRSNKSNFSCSCRCSSWPLAPDPWPLFHLTFAGRDFPVGFRSSAAFAASRAVFTSRFSSGGGS
jgi:hypothetical protein